MKRIALVAVVPLVLLGAYLGLRAHFTHLANEVADRLEHSAERCALAIQEHEAQFDITAVEESLGRDQRAAAELPQWAVGGGAKVRIAAAESAVKKGVVELQQFVAQEKERAARAAEANERIQRDAAVKQQAEADRKSAEQRARISAAVANAGRAGMDSPAGGWPLTDPWPNDLKPARVLIWDQAKRDIHDAQSSLPEELRGTPDDAELLVCAVVKEHLQKVAEYLPPAAASAAAAAPLGKLPAHRMWQAIRLIRYPSGERIGEYTIVGDFPAMETQVSRDPATQRALVGEYRKPLARWLAGRFQPAGPMEQFLAETNPTQAAKLADRIGPDVRLASSPALPYLARKLRSTDDAALQYQVIRVVQAVKRESADFQGDLLGRKTAPPIGPPNWQTFAAHRPIFLASVQEWLKRQAPE